MNLLLPKPVLVEKADEEDDSPAEEAVELVETDEHWLPDLLTSRFARETDSA